MNLNRAAHTAYFSNLRGTLDALLNVVLVPVPSWGRGLVGLVVVGSAPIRHLFTAHIFRNFIAFLQLGGHGEAVQTYAEN